MNGFKKFTKVRFLNLSENTEDLFLLCCCKMNLSTKDPFVFHWPFSQITVEQLHLDSLLLSSYMYEQGLVKFIERQTGSTLQHTLNNVGEYIDIKTQLTPSDYSIKIEGMERLSSEIWKVISAFVGSHWHEKIPFSCHCFIASQNSPSFDRHTDPDGVVIYTVDGVKSMEVNDEEFLLKPSTALWLPHGTPHRATNRHNSVMLSIGFERYHMEKLYA